MSSFPVFRISTPRLLHATLAPALALAIAGCDDNTVGPAAEPSAFQTLAPTVVGSARGGGRASLREIEITPAVAQVDAGAQYQFTATGILTDGSPASVKVAFSAIGGSVTSDGLFTAGPVGTTALVIASAKGLKDTAQVAIVGDMAPAPAPTPDLPPSPPSDAPGLCSDYAHSRQVAVSDAAELAHALANAEPGDLIVLSDGTYVGNWNISRSGTASQRITLCGSRRAVLQRGSLSSGNGVYLSASYWTLAGFRVTTSQVGIRTAGGSYNVLERLEIDGVGQAGIHLNKFSRHNIVRQNYIHDTGKYIAEYGEAVYVGTYAGQWGATTGGAPDRTDSTIVSGNILGPNIGSNHIDVKAGAVGTVIDGNTIDGAGTDPSAANWNSAILNNGNYTVIRNNHVAGVREYAAEVWTDVAGWALGTVYHGNVFDMSASARSTAVQVWSAATVGPSTIVGCDNTAHGAALSNLPCR